MDNKKIQIWYISEDFMSYGKGEDVSFNGGNIDTKVLSVFNLYCAVICDLDTLHNLLGISGKEDTDELGYAWLTSEYGEDFETKFSSDKQPCNEKGIKEWYICDSCNHCGSHINVTGLKAIFIGTRTNFLNIILELECNKARNWTFVTKFTDIFIVDGITVKTK